MCKSGINTGKYDSLSFSFCSSIPQGCLLYLPTAAFAPLMLFHSPPLSQALTEFYCLR